MSLLIEKKIDALYFDQILSGHKTFELRLADFTCEAGDTLLLREVDATTKEYTGREVRKRVGSVLKTKDVTFFEDQDIEKFGYQVISLLTEEKK
jgi:hypothetical protein